MNKLNLNNGRISKDEGLIAFLYKNDQEGGFAVLRQSSPQLRRALQSAYELAIENGINVDTIEWDLHARLLVLNKSDDEQVLGICISIYILTKMGRLKGNYNGVMTLETISSL